jgi:hypothetical protein
MQDVIITAEAMAAGPIRQRPTTILEDEMPGVFNVPAAGLKDVNVDEILAYVDAAAKTDAPLSESDAAYKEARDAAVKLLETTPEGPKRERVRRALRKMINKNLAKKRTERAEATAQIDRMRLIQEAGVRNTAAQLAILRLSMPLPPKSITVMRLARFVVCFVLTVIEHSVC